jgi:2-polyprenyl-3-methyl-5-hydroxy-6-metoxy-1,4-benzoquinol methylase
MSFQQRKFPACPVCTNETISLVMPCTDHSLTKENFDILQCIHCTHRYTFPIPAIEKIAPYYNFTEYISHTDTNDGWMNKLYHKVRQRTLSQKTKWIQSLFTGYKGNILDIGAGTGAFAHAMQEKGWKVTALEPDENTRKRALEINSIQLFPIETLYNLPDQTFDVITLWHVLEHVHDLNGYFESFKKLLKPNGRLIIAVPNYTSFDASYYKSFWAAYDVPRHLYHFSPNSMAQLCLNYHLNIVQTKPMWYDSFYVSLLSEKYIKSGFLGTLRALIVGFISNLVAFRNNKKASSIIYEIKNG